MIDILKAKESFKEYVKNYNPEDGKIALKIEHTYKTSEIAKNTAIYLNLDEEDVKLAELIGLLHDIGRFEQIKRYNTFSDRNSINHGEFGVKLLFEDGLIRKFIDENKYDNIIKKAILNHNRKEIEKGLTEKELLHSKIIRDADKTDIYRVLVEDTIENAYCIKDISNEVITKEILEMYIKEPHIIDYSKMKSPVDSMVAHFSYVYDFNYNYGLEIISEEKYLYKLSNKVEFKNKKTKEEIELIYKMAKDYLEKCLNK